jgi:hypothetical protein
VQRPSPGSLYVLHNLDWSGKSRRGGWCWREFWDRKRARVLPEIDLDLGNFGLDRLDHAVDTGFFALLCHGGGVGGYREEGSDGEDDLAERKHGVCDC